MLSFDRVGKFYCFIVIYIYIYNIGQCEFCSWKFDFFLIRDVFIVILFLHFTCVHN